MDINYCIFMTKYFYCIIYCVIVAKNFLFMMGYNIINRVVGGVKV